MIVSPGSPALVERYPVWAAAWVQAEYVAVHGSVAYGLDTDDSDIDLKGSYIPRRDALLGYRELPAVP